MKRRSIRWQFTIIFVCMTALVITAVWCTNNWALEDYYMNYKVDILEKAYTEIDNIVKRETQNPAPVRWTAWMLCSMRMRRQPVQMPRSSRRLYRSFGIHPTLLC